MTTTPIRFVYLQNAVALHTVVRNSRLVARPSLWRLSRIHKARAEGDPVHLIHGDALVFAEPEGAGRG